MKKEVRNIRFKRSLFEITKESVWLILNEKFNNRIKREYEYA